MIENVTHRISPDPILLLTSGILTQQVILTLLMIWWNYDNIDTQILITQSEEIGEKLLESSTTPESKNAPGRRLAFFSHFFLFALCVSMQFGSTYFMQTMSLWKNNLISLKK